MNSQSRVEVIDTHCHLFLMAGEPRTVVEAARAAGVTALVCAGIDAESSRRSRELADAVNGVFATAGVHPHQASGFDAVAGSAVEELLADPRVVAVGETGLDYYRMNSPAEDQRKAFRAHCGLARETGKPIVVHTRDAWPDVLAILDEEAVERVVLHCFSGDVVVAKEAAARRYFCSFAGNVSYPKNGELRVAAAELPLDLLLVETDSPFLAPQSVRGSDNAPANIPMVVASVAEARGEDAGDIAEATTRNARRAFDLPQLIHR
ncbi:MAG TPA: TatD family hydrolase [Actinomycetota bacterium]|nr:TatD family hydrolase [Actinomycetota bacterium]